MCINKNNDLVVPLLQQKLAELVVKRDICQQHARYLKKKLYCKFCDTKNSHNTSACIKKQKEDKDKKKGSNTGKTDKEVKPDTSHERREASEIRKRDLSNMRKNNGSPVTHTNSCVQV